MKVISSRVVYRNSRRSASHSSDWDLKSVPRSNLGFMALKRMLDILIAVAVFVLIMSWLVPLMAILIKMDSRGPVFFRQKRVGFRGRIFTCLKFRTMRVNEACHERQATETDPRITRLGRWLRKPGLDELPQFWNVLTGQMSIIGPRPHMLTDDNYFSAVIPSYEARQHMKPGITGMAQVMGCRGATETYDAIYRRVQWDIYYLKRASPWLDAYILWRSAGIVVRFILARSKSGRGSLLAATGIKQKIVA